MPQRNIKKPLWKIIFEYFLIIIGATLAALSVGWLLIPQDVIDSGIVGISLMLSNITGKIDWFPQISAGVFTTLLNIPFLWFGYKHGGKKFIVRCIFAIILFSILLVTFEHHVPTFVTGNTVTEPIDKAISIIFGAVVLGLGVGLILRFGGSLDGTEMFSLWVSKRTNMSVGTLLMIINVFIFTAAIFVFGLNSALYSMVMYFGVTKIIDFVVEGIDEAKAVMIVTTEPEEMASIIMSEMGRSITYLNGTKGYTKNECQIIYSVVTRLEISQLRDIVSRTDSQAFMTITNLADVVGGHRHLPHNSKPKVPPPPAEIVLEEIA